MTAFYAHLIHIIFIRMGIIGRILPVVLFGALYVLASHSGQWVSLIVFSVVIFTFVCSYIMYMLPDSNNDKDRK